MNWRHLTDRLNWATESCFVLMKNRIYCVYGQSVVAVTEMKKKWDQLLVNTNCYLIAVDYDDDEKIL